MLWMCQRCNVCVKLRGKGRPRKVLCCCDIQRPQRACVPHHLSFIFTPLTPFDFCWGLWERYVRIISAMYPELMDSCHQLLAALQSYSRSRGEYPSCACFYHCFNTHISPADNARKETDQQYVDGVMLWCYLRSVSNSYNHGRVSQLPNASNICFVIIAGQCGQSSLKLLLIMDRSKWK